MEIPLYHNCQMLSSENEKITTKYKKLTRKFKELQHSFKVLEEETIKLRVEKENCQSTHLVNHPPSVVHSIPAWKQNIPVEKNPFQKKEILQLHTNLLKRLERESRQTASQSKKLQKLEHENEKLKEDLFSTQQQVEFLQQQIDEKNTQLKILKNQLIEASEPEQHKYTNLKRNHQKLLSENKKLKDELKGLDNSFFEEIEDMKYALQQSAKLNKQYEKAIQKLCSQFNVPYESVVNKKR